MTTMTKPQLIDFKAKLVRAKGLNDERHPFLTSIMHDAGFSEQEVEAYKNQKHTNGQLITWWYVERRLQGDDT